MESLFRSETMHLYQIIVSNEAAYDCISELGKAGTLHFRNLNSSESEYNRKFVSEVLRCNAIESKLRFLLEHARAHDITIVDNPEDAWVTPHSRELNHIETILEELDVEYREANRNANILKKNFQELTEIYHLLSNSEKIFDDGIPDLMTQQLLMDQTDNTDPSAGKLGFVTGVISRERLPNFERMLWRYSRGTALLRVTDIDEKLDDLITGLPIAKSVFVVFFHGDHLKDPIRKICEGFRANMHACPQTSSERQAMAAAAKIQLNDMVLVIDQSKEHRKRLLTAAAKNLSMWSIKVQKTKAIYHFLNLFLSDVTHKCLIAEAWCPVADAQHTWLALEEGTIKSGTSMPSLFNRIDTDDTPPTYNRTNKFTHAFQVLIDAYGVANYREMNPAPYTIITFPFLFSVMFGDFGHGLIMALFAIWMILNEKRFSMQRTTNEIWKIFFAGRYIILLMGLFSMYAGFIYNDIFSKSVNVFGSTWRVNFDRDTLSKNKILQLDPKTDFTQSAYPIGLDPVWAIAPDNRIIFLNGFKMKIAIVFGVTHMIFGVSMSLFNHAHFRHTVDIFTCFIPQIIFLLFLFLYLVVLMFVKWILYSTTNERVMSEACAPSILITFINMMLNKYPDESAPCPLYMFPSQPTLQRCLFLIAILCIPVMMFAKPIWVRHQRKKRNALAAKNPKIVVPTDEDDMSEVFIHQGIHTIEYVLGSVSHTASYLRLWALSLAHSQLAEVLWGMVLIHGLEAGSIVGPILLYFIFGAWSVLTITILVVMEGLSAFLHTLRLHWVEFQSKFYGGTGYLFVPFKLMDVGGLLAEQDD